MNTVRNFAGGAVGILLLMLMGSAVQAQPGPAAPLWDAYVVVAGELRSDGTVRACTTERARLINGQCWVPGLIANAAGSPESFTTQAFLERVLDSEALAKKPVAVGVLPHWTSSGGKSPKPVLANDAFVILYRVTK